MSKIIMINGHSVTFDVENPDASDPHHAPFDEALVEKILNGVTVPNAPAMLDMASNTDTFDFDVPYGNKWVDKGYIDVGYEYPDDGEADGGYVATLGLPTIEPEGTLYSDAVLVQTDIVQGDGEEGAREALSLLLEALPEMFPGIEIER